MIEWNIQNQNRDLQHNTDKHFLYKLRGDNDVVYTLQPIHSAKRIVPTTTATPEAVRTGFTFK